MEQILRAIAIFFLTAMFIFTPFVLSFLLYQAIKSKDMPRHALLIIIISVSIVFFIWYDVVLIREVIKQFF